MNTLLERSMPVHREMRPNPPLVPAASTWHSSALGGEFLAQALDEVDVGLMVLSFEGRPLFANRAALRACGQHARFRLEDGILRAACVADASAFARALHDARRGRRTLLPLIAGPTEVDNADGGSMRFLAFIPLERASTAIVDPHAQAVLLVFGRRQICGALGTQFFAHEHGMTIAECGVFEALCEGQSPRQIAQCLGIAISTVRTHVMHIREKTGASSISDLLRITAMLPPLVGACDSH